MPDLTRPRRTRLLRARHTLLVAAALLLPDLAFAQTLRGRVIDAGDERPLAGAEVVLTSGTQQLRAVADAAGSFVVTTGAGSWRVRASMIGYAAFDAPPVAIGRDELVEVTLRLSRSPMQLPGIAVDTRRADPRHDATYEGFLARRALLPPIGNRRAVHRTDPEMVNAVRIEDVLLWFPPPRRSLHEDACPIGYFINGMLATAAQLEFIMELPMVEFEGIEYYRSAIDAPLMMGMGTSTCPIAAIWMRRPGSVDPPGSGTGRFAGARLALSLTASRLDGENAPDDGPGVELLVEFPIIGPLHFALVAGRAGHSLDAETVAWLSTAIGRDHGGTSQPLRVSSHGVQSRLDLPGVGPLRPGIALRYRWLRRAFDPFTGDDARSAQSTGRSVGAGVGIDLRVVGDVHVNTTLVRERFTYEGFRSLERREHVTGARWLATTLSVGVVWVMAGW
jgi:hypothetical protein